MHHDFLYDIVSRELVARQAEGARNGGRLGPLGQSGTGRIARRLRSSKPTRTAGAARPAKPMWTSVR